MPDIDSETRRGFATYLRTLARDAENAAWDEESPLRGEWRDKPRRVVSLLAGKMRQAGELLSATVAERDAERALSDRLAEALREFQWSDVRNGCAACPACGGVVTLGHTRGHCPVSAALAAYDANRSEDQR